MKNYYKTLGINTKATDADIKKAYKRLALMFHPDVNKSKDASAKFIEINEAYETLIDPQSRAGYDVALEESLSAPRHRQPRPFEFDNNIPYAEGVTGTDTNTRVEHTQTTRDLRSMVLRIIRGLILWAIVHAILNALAGK